MASWDFLLSRANLCDYLEWEDIKILKTVCKNFKSQYDYYLYRMRLLQSSLLLLEDQEERYKKLTDLIKEQRFPHIIAWIHDCIQVPADFKEREIVINPGPHQRVIKITADDVKTENQKLFLTNLYDRVGHFFHALYVREIPLQLIQREFFRLMSNETSKEFLRLYRHWFGRELNMQDEQWGLLKDLKPYIFLSNACDYHDFFARLLPQENTNHPEVFLEGRDLAEATTIPRLLRFFDQHPEDVPAYQEYIDGMGLSIPHTQYLTATKAAETFFQDNWIYLYYAFRNLKKHTPRLYQVLGNARHWWLGRYKLFRHSIAPALIFLALRLEPETLIMSINWRFFTAAICRIGFVFRDSSKFKKPRECLEFAKKIETHLDLLEHPVELEDILYIEYAIVTSPFSLYRSVHPGEMDEDLQTNLSKYANFYNAIRQV